MLSKKQFNAATNRLQKIVTTSDLIQMLRHQITQVNRENQFADFINQIDDISAVLKETQPLDRRRAENYLANAIYGKNHSQIAHLIKGSHRIDDKEFGGRAEIYGKFIKSLGAGYHYELAPLIDVHAIDLAKKLRTTSPEDFKVSYCGFSSESGRFDNMHQYNVLMYVSFLDLDIQIEFIFIRDESSERREPFEEFFSHISLNGMSLNEYGKKIVCKHVDDYCEDSYEFALESIFLNVISEMVTRDTSKTYDFYCLEFPESLMKKHVWNLNFDSKYIANNLIKGYIISAVKLSFYDDNRELDHERIKEVFSCDEDFNIDKFVLNLSGFLQKDIENNYVSGSIHLLNKKYDANISIKFSYDNDYDFKFITRMDVFINDGIIYSCSDEETLNGDNYPLRNVVFNLRTVIPYINALVK